MFSGKRQIESSLESVPDGPYLKILNQIICNEIEYLPKECTL